MSETARQIQINLQRVREQIAQAAERSGRKARTIKLIAVTKYVEPEVASELVQAGCTDLAESRPQDLWRKVDLLGDSQVNWHMIGHLQRNKVRRTLPRIAMLHAGDSLRLLKSVNNVAAELNLFLPTLLEVNVSGDSEKHGFEPDQLEAALPEVVQLRHVKVKGLMCMAGRESGLDGARRDFEELRLLQESLAKNCPDQISLEELSMGMSRDFEVAIEQGATMVRIGSTLFAGL